MTPSAADGSTSHLRSSRRETAFEGKRIRHASALPIAAVLTLAARIGKSLTLDQLAPNGENGALILGNTIFTVLTSAPGPLHLNWPGGSFAELKTLPVIWLPAFLAPFAVAAHIFSMRQNWFGDGAVSNTRLRSAHQ